MAAAIESRQEVDRLRRSEAWLSAQKRAFQAAVTGAPLKHSLEILIRTAIEQTEGMARCGFWAANDAGTGLHHLVGLPDAYAKRIDGFRIGPESLACGLAVSLNEPVITPDVNEEPRWHPWLWLAEEFGYRAVWSFPVQTDGEMPIGTFAMYFTEPRDATQEDRELAAVMANAAAIIISRNKEAEERAQVEEHRELLIGELQHRTRNLMGVVRSITERTIARSSSLEEFRDAYLRRIAALGRAQGLLSRLKENDRVTFDELIRAELAIYDSEAESRGRVTLRGPAAVRLRSSTVQILALAIHELTTNAAKYGAIKQPKAHLDIHWEVVSVSDGSLRLEIDWRESGVEIEDLEAARHNIGQGRELIEEGLPYQLRARTSFHIEADGVHCRMRVPISPTGEQPIILQPRQPAGFEDIIARARAATVRCRQMSNRNKELGSASHDLIRRARESCSRTSALLKVSPTRGEPLRSRRAGK